MPTGAAVSLADPVPAAFAEPVAVALAGPLSLGIAFCTGGCFIAIGFGGGGGILVAGGTGTLAG